MQALLSPEERPREDWRDTIGRLREESNHVLREIWAAKRVGLDDAESVESAREPEPREP